MKTKLMILSWFEIVLAATLLLSSGCIKFVNDNPVAKTTPTGTPQVTQTLQPTQTPLPTQTTQSQWTQNSPVIKSFAAKPASIKQGESAVLSWEVTGATKITISPNVGDVNATGTATVKPAAKTEYTITAENQAGKVNQSITIEVAAVAPPPSGPDITITSLFLQVNEIYFKVKNIGNEASPATRAKLYINDVVDVYGDTYVDPLNPGEEKTEVFGKFVWDRQVPSGIVSSGKNIQQWEIKVCLDVENLVKELNKNNNCSSIILGQEFLYRFIDNVNNVTWISTAGPLVLPVAENNPGGFIGVSQGNVLSTYPAASAGGWISGTFAEFFVDEFRRPSSRSVVLPRHCRFMTEVKFDKNAAANAKARFIFTALDQSLTPVITKYLDLSGNTADYNWWVDLTPLADKSCTFILRVESQGTPGGDLGVWINPVITQKW
jgi:hypothetical protein